MSVQVILYHLSTCPPCKRFINSGDWGAVQSMCRNEGLDVVFKEYEYTRDKKKFDEKNIAATPTLEILDGDKSYLVDAQPPKELFKIIKARIEDKPTQTGGGKGSIYYEKYLKYKNKYIALKMSM